MKRFLLLFVLVGILSVQAQVPNPFHPKVHNLAKKFKARYEDDSLRMVAIYDWMNTYMRYDYKAFKKYKFKVNSYSYNRLLYRRKALCYGLSKLYKEICLQSGIQCIMMEGYSLENPEDPYSHYYYDDHAWNAVKLNGTWYLSDVTFGNGRVVLKKRRIRTFLNKIVGIPVVYNKTKYCRERPLYNHDFLAQSGDKFIGLHYPVLINGILLNQKITLDSFATGQFKVKESYNASFYPTMANLENFMGKEDEPFLLKTKAEQSMLFNPKNKLVKAVNYYNAVIRQGKIRDNFNKSDVDTVIKYAMLFKKSNTALHGINNRRVKDEHTRLLAPLGKTSRHNSGLAVLFGRKAWKASIKLAKSADVNQKNADKISARLAKMTNARQGTSRKDTIPFVVHLNNHRQSLLAGDSILQALNGSEQELDSLSHRAAVLFDTLYHCLQLRTAFVEGHINRDVFLNAYPRMKYISKALDSLTVLIDRYKVKLDKSESEYNRCRSKCIRTSTTGFNLASKDYLHIKTRVFVTSPYYKDSLLAEDLVRAEVFKNRMVNFYHHDEALIRKHAQQFSMARAHLKIEKRLIKKAIKLRMMAYSVRIKHENSRYRAYDFWVLKMAANMQRLKIMYKRKPAFKRK